MGKKSGSGSVMNSPDHISESLETIVLVKILKFFYADQGSRIRDGKNLDPQHCVREMERDSVYNAIAGWQERKYFVINAVFRIQIGSDPSHFAGSGSGSASRACRSG